MKFARYLDDAQAPEWKRAYIDYRGLKKRISAVRRSMEGEARDTRDSSNDEPDGDLSPGMSSASLHQHDPPQHLSNEKLEDAQAEVDLAEVHRDLGMTAARARKDSALTFTPDGDVRSSKDSGNADSIHTTHPDAAAPIPSPSLPVPMPKPDTTARATATPSPSRFSNMRRRVSTIRVHKGSGSFPYGSGPLTLNVVLSSMSPVQLAFFDKVDRELVKIEAFYLAREQDARARAALLQLQLAELRDHRHAFYEAHPEAPPTWMRPLSFLSSHKSHRTARTASRVRRALHHAHTVPLSMYRSQPSSPIKEKEKEKEKEKKEKSDEEKVGASPEVDLGRIRTHVLDPEEYQAARKRLKKAVVEFYRYLEVLNNYRILNLTGFRKALKKFEKTTGIPVQEIYMKEQVEPCAFTSGDFIQKLVKEMEVQFAARFMHGDRKRALVRLRAGTEHKTHHFSTFRTGLALGLAVPALVDGIVRSFRADTRAAISGWNSLLFVYSILLVPSIFAFLVGLNLLVWNHARINYVFIFELDIRTRLDHREYLELPAIVLAALCYAFWLSFARVGEGSIAPTTWPLIWLLFVFGVIVNPIPIYFRDSRWWLIRHMARLLTSGAYRVEFTDFWMGDQICSLLFSLSNLYFIACAYNVGFHPDPFPRCSTLNHWEVRFVLAAVPLLARFTQSVRRWMDSRLVTHLINAGKYALGVVYTLCYYLWRHHGAKDSGAMFPAFCLFGTIYSTYASSWDLLMDWSLLRPHAKHRLLRDELIYSSYVPLYYFAIISNVCIRFVWVIYIPQRGPSLVLRTWIAAMLEILRRWQWNFYRLENEHLGNVDQYRITREVPLPYSFDTIEHESDGEEDGDGEVEDTVVNGKVKT